MIFSQEQTCLEPTWHDGGQIELDGHVLAPIAAASSAMSSKQGPNKALRAARCAFALCWPLLLGMWTGRRCICNREKTQPRRKTTRRPPVRFGWASFTRDLAASPCSHQLGLRSQSPLSLAHKPTSERKLVQGLRQRYDHDVFRRCVQVVHVPSMQPCKHAT